MWCTMAVMRQGIVHTFAWSLATGAAVTLSWWGVHSVMAGTAYDPPRAVPMAAEPPPSSVPSLVAATERPPPPHPGTPEQPSSPASPSHGPSPSSPAPPPKPLAKDPAAPPSAPPGDTKSYQVAGGRAVFELGADTASLVSATPEPGWQMHVWTEQGWIRVEFTRDDRADSVFCTWNGHPPAVQLDAH
jgi:hypothetical protein